jgi:excisionase family DNA binding protein
LNVEKLLFSTTEVADIFKVNRVTVYRWIKEGRVSACEIGKHFKIPAGEIRRLVEEFGMSGGVFWDMYRRVERSRSAAAKRSAADRERKLVVSVSDDPVVLAGIEEVLGTGEADGRYAVMTFSDSLSAAIGIDGQRPDLLILDGIDAGDDGMEFALTIKSIFHDVAVVCLAKDPGRCARDCQENLNALGAVLLKKPAAVGDIRDTLAKRLSS